MPEWEDLVGHVRVGELAEQVTRFRPLDVENHVARSHIGDDDVGIFWRVALQPGLRVGVQDIARDHQVTILRETCHREVRFDPPAFIQPLGVGDLTDRNCDIVGADAIEH